MRRKGVVLRAADRLLQRIVPATDADEVIGDLTEEARLFETTLRGRLGATLWYWGQAIALGLRYATARSSSRARPARAFARPSWRRKASSITALLGDVRHAARFVFRRHESSARGVTVLIVCTLALGIGATAAVFSVVDAVVLRPLPYPGPERLVSVLEINRGEGLSHIPASALDFLAWREQATLLTNVTAYTYSPRALSTTDSQPERLPAAAVRAGFFELFQVPPLLGRGLTEADQAGDATPVVVLSHGLWQRRFGGDEAVVGSTLRLDGQAFEIVGIMPPGFVFPATVQLWVPLIFSPRQLDDRNWHFADTLARLAPGASLAAVNEELAAIAAQQAEAFPDSNEGWTAQAFPLHRQLVGDAAGMLWGLFGAVGFVLLIGCTNVTNLLLVRAIGRRREMAIRAALGATRLQQLRQLLAEAMVITAIASAVAVAIAWIGMRAIVAVSPVGVVGSASVELNTDVLLFMLAVAGSVALLAGLAPLATLRANSTFASLKATTRSVSGGEYGRFRSLLVGGEVALAVVLVIGASLMMQSLRNVVTTDPGFPPQGLLTAQLSLPSQTYDSPERIRGFWTRLLERLDRHPRIDAAALASWLPPFSGPLVHHRIDGVHEAWTIDLPAARNRHVSADYLRTLGVPLIRGRLIDGRDGEGSRRVAVIDEAFARQFFADEDPIGRSIRVWEDEPREIVGIVGNVKNVGLGAEAQPTSYIPLAQTPWPDQGLIVRATGEPAELVPLLRHEIAELDPTLPLFGVETMGERLARSVATPTFQTRFIGSLSVIALLLAVIGIYGLIARNVTERTAEIGVRIALGADAAAVRRMILAHSLRLTVVGLAVGIPAAYALRDVLADLLFGIDSIDATMVGVAALVIVGAAIAAAWLPARRAGRMDPRRALLAD